MKPVTIRELLKDDAFKGMMKTVPRLPEPLTHGTPWQLWAVTNEGKWATKQYATYGDVWRKAVSCIRDVDTYRDVCVVSRRVLLPPPAELASSLKDQWCGRCRRPSVFRRWHETHHALKRMPVLTDDEPYRCYFCGIRRAALPNYYR